MCFRGEGSGVVMLFSGDGGESKGKLFVLLRQIKIYSKLASLFQNKIY